MRDTGVTIVLVTHLMEEAERLCDRVALIDHGKVIALGPPTHLGEQAATSKRARLRASGPLAEEILEALPEVTAVERHGPDLVVIGSGNLVTAAVLALDHGGLVAEDVRTEASTLEDAFLALTEASKNGEPKSGATR